MRTVATSILALAAAITALHAQTDQSASSAAPVRTYRLLREDEEWSFLKDPSLRQDIREPLKYISLGHEGWFLTIGGEAREALEQVGNDNWGKQPYTNTFFLERYMLHTDWRFGKHFRVFVQLKSGLESFRQGGYRPIDEKKLDFEAAFVELGAGEGDHWVVLQAGRQELNYGSGRLVSVREGPNVRQSFDGARLKMKSGAWRVDAFAARPDLDKPGYFDNVPDHRTSFWGVYATRPWRNGVSFDTYYLGLEAHLFRSCTSRAFAPPWICDCLFVWACVDLMMPTEQCAVEFKAEHSTHRTIGSSPVLDFFFTLSTLTSNTLQLLDCGGKKRHALLPGHHRVWRTSTTCRRANRLGHHSQLVLRVGVRPPPNLRCPTLLLSADLVAVHRLWTKKRCHGRMGRRILIPCPLINHPVRRCQNRSVHGVC